MAGFSFTGSGESDDPGVHRSFLSELSQLLPRFEGVIGSGEFNSPHAAMSFPEAPGPETPSPADPSPGPEASTPSEPDPGAGAPAS
jgi:hypothetical protein